MASCLYERLNVPVCLSFPFVIQLISNICSSNTRNIISVGRCCSSHNHNHISASLIPKRTPQWTWKSVSLTDTSAFHDENNAFYSDRILLSLICFCRLFAALSDLQTSDSSVLSVKIRLLLDMGRSTKTGEGADVWPWSQEVALPTVRSRPDFDHRGKVGTKAWKCDRYQVHLAEVSPVPEPALNGEGVVLQVGRGGWCL